MRTHICKTDGCEKESRSPVGRYAYCDDCREERLAAQTSSAAVSTVQPRQVSYEQKARAASRDLASVGRRLDRAKAAAAKAATELRDAQAAWEVALRGLAGSQ